MCIFLNSVILLNINPLIQLILLNKGTRNTQISIFLTYEIYSLEKKNINQIIIHTKYYEGKVHKNT